MRPRWLVFSVSAVALAAAIGLAFAFFRDDESTPTPIAPDPSPTATATPDIPVARPTPIPVTFGPPGTNAPAAVRTLEARPESVFPPFHGTNAVIYDTQTGRTTDLGEGGNVAISTDGRYAAWIRGEWYADALSFPAVRGDAWLLTLATGDQRRIGPAQVATFVEGDRIALQAPRTPFEDAKWRLFDVDTLQPSADQTTEPPPQWPDRVMSTGHILKVEPVAGAELPRGGIGRVKASLMDPATRATVMQFEAYSVTDATATELVVASPWEIITDQPFIAGHVELYILDVTTQQTKWIASARASTPNWALSANADRVVWTNDYCSENAKISVLQFDRRTELLEEIRAEWEYNSAWLFLTPSGLLAQGTFGPTALIDPQTLKYTAVLPPVQLASDAPFAGWVPVQAGWFADYRYATYYFAGGHGGLC